MVFILKDSSSKVTLFQAYAYHTGIFHAQNLLIMTASSNSIHLSKNTNKLQQLK